MTDPNDMLAILDRIVAPLTAQMVGVMDKLDRVADQLAQIGVLHQGQTQHNAAISRLQDDTRDQSLLLAKISGRNQVMLWAVGLIGTAFAIVAAAGVVHFLGWTR